jgi:hypothetical protein
VKELYDDAVECLDMGEQMLTVKSEVVGHLVQSVDLKIL